MKRHEFITKACKAIAENQIKGNCREKILELALTGEVHTVNKMSKQYNDLTDKMIAYLEFLGVEKARIHNKAVGKKDTELSKYDFDKGYCLYNDAPRGGKCGTVLGINWEW